MDTSALVAIVLKEPDGSLYHLALKRSTRVLISTVSLVETRIVINGRLGASGVAILDGLLEWPTFEVVPPSAREADLAYRAFLAYGKGQGNSAGLNLGDLFAYALAKSFGIPLLFKGKDFSQTDIEAVPLR